MLKVISFLGIVTSLCIQCTDEESASYYKLKNNYNVETVYESDICHSHSMFNIKVDGRPTHCFCGEAPKMVAIYHDHVEAFCLKHIPEKKIYIDDVLKDGEEL